MWEETARWGSVLPKIEFSVVDDPANDRVGGPRKGPAPPAIDVALAHDRPRQLQHRLRVARQALHKPQKSAHTHTRSQTRAQNIRRLHWAYFDKLPLNLIGQIFLIVALPQGITILPWRHSPASLASSLRSTYDHKTRRESNTEFRKI